MCNQMVTSEIRERLGKLLGFGQNAREIRERLGKLLGFGQNAREIIP